MKRIVCVLFVLSAVACGSQKEKSSHGDSAAKNPQGAVVGGDRDEHGCLTSAGYTWSELRKDCIRLWEESPRFTPSTDKNSSLAAYLVFSADSSRVEVFFPGRKGVVLPSVSGESTPLWRNEAKDMVMHSSNRGWVLVNSVDGVSWVIKTDK